MYVSMESNRRWIVPDNGDTVSVSNVWNTSGTFRDSSAEERVSPHDVVNHVASTMPSVNARVSAPQTGSRRGDVNRTKRLSSFSVADILGPRYGSSSQQPQQHHDASDESSDDGRESTSTRSNEDLSTSVFSHDSSTDAPSTTGSDRDHCWAETERRLSTSRKLQSSLFTSVNNGSRK